MEPAWNLSSSLNTFSLWGAIQAITFRGQRGRGNERGQERAVEILKLMQI
jgi:hypothetical protein